MSRTVFCQKLKKDAEGLEKPPFPGEEGVRIFENICQQVWQEWLGYQTILVNEYRLSSIDPKARLFLAEEREKFLFGEGIDLPEQFNARE
jgi:Fe-S cluster biosynthesis and repair protein YggX